MSYDYIPPHQSEVDTRLVHWAIWVKVAPQPWAAQPMFKQYRSQPWEAEAPRTVINTLECLWLERMVSKLPTHHKTALRWAYVYSWVPDGVVRRSLEVSRKDLAQLLVEGRNMLILEMQRRAYA